MPQGFVEKISVGKNFRLRRDGLVHRNYTLAMVNALIQQLRRAAEAVRSQSTAGK